MALHFVSERLGKTQNLRVVCWRKVYVEHYSGIILFHRRSKNLSLR